MDVSDHPIAASVRPTSLPTLALATVVAILAFVSPVDMSRSDAAFAMLVSRTLLYEGTFALNSSIDDPVVGRDLAKDYRIRRNGDGDYLYYSFGVPVLSLPAVALAELAGWDLRRAEDDARLQNVLSALVCFTIVLLLYRLLIVWLDPLAAWLITAVSCLGSSLVSTLGTALWNSGYQLVCVIAAAILIVSRRPAPFMRVAILLSLAALCRPTTGFFLIAVLAFWLQREKPGAVVRAAGVGLAGLAILLVGAALGATLPVPLYYDPTRLFRVGDPVEGLMGILFSPSRGLLVFSPFLVVAIAGMATVGRRIWRNPVAHLAGIWILLHVTAVAFKKVWWGGHSFGPRLLLEIIPAFAILTALVWRELASSRKRWIWLGVYSSCGLIALAIHGYSGLFNTWTVRWNERPGINIVPEENFNWRFPQFLASESSVEERYQGIQQRLRVPYPLGESIEGDSRYAVFRGWSPPAADWRWSREPRAEIAIELMQLEEAELFLLEIEAGANGRQRFRPSWNDLALGEMLMEGFEPQRETVVLPPATLRLGENLLRIELPDAAAVAGRPRLLGIALRSLRIRGLRGDFRGFDFRDAGLFHSGFGEQESAWRWTDGQHSVLSFPVVRSPSRDDPTLVFRVGALGRQRVEVRWDGESLGWMDVEGFEPIEIRVAVDPALLEPKTVHEIELYLPDATWVAGDSRQLGLAFHSLTLCAWKATGPTCESPAARSD